MYIHGWGGDVLQTAQNSFLISFFGGIGFLLPITLSIN